MTSKVKLTPDSKAIIWALWRTGQPIMVPQIGERPYWAWCDEREQGCGHFC